ncbi:Transmembrane protein [Parasponia andersonii]|uniref:Transmembrane protein n=1 Tax=Parasponia andersonii TaxID=3476 RepID=A0A2P5B867_PARAD|nr:Transmembrane protein [Parasponia andersonii]
MEDYETHQHHHQQPIIPKETALQALNTIIQLHFEKTLEKKRAIDLQKKELHKLFLLFFIFLGLIFLSQSQSQRLQCRHCWIPIILLSLAHLIFYVSVAQTLRCINGFKYQRRCHKLTLGLATEKLREMKMRIVNGGTAGGGGEFEGVGDDEFEIHYQEPPESYFGKFKRNWALHFGFLILIYGFMVSSSVVLLCF